MKKKSKIQNLIDKLRGKKPTLHKMCLKNTINISKKHLKNCNLKIYGENNIISISELAHIQGNVTVSIYGDNNIVKISDGAKIFDEFGVYVGLNHPNFGKVNNALFEIGENSTVEALKYVTYNSNAKCYIGKNCMFSSGITIYNTDAHPIYDINTSEIVNKVKEIKIGNHCWIGMNVTLLKNTQIADDCIVGFGSVVSGKHLTPHCAIAGNPAKKVKEGITWHYNGSNGYVQNLIENF